MKGTGPLVPHAREKINFPLFFDVSGEHASFHSVIKGKLWGKPARFRKLLQRAG